MTEMTQKRVMLAGFRLLRKKTEKSHYLIQYRDRSLFAVCGNDDWQTMASYVTKRERDFTFDTLLRNDVWTVEV